MEQTPSKTTSDPALNEHYTLYVLLKDKTVFESELRQNGILWRSDFDNQPNIDDGIRYYLSEIDMQKIDQIIIENGIEAQKDTPLANDFKDKKKVMKMYLVVAMAVVVLLLLMVLVEYLSH
ncbi:hypothetical protein HPE56_09280 [Maribacter sp. ANRC-HE7]|uniref:Uncharacterized protein n=1 Tax=Maribacter aquimaris TaxID=2737171 RepID=A0ABR7V0Y3_9FLAO|nr:hypothetical protein [Maribacter aquimaris]MBD0777985.1 hypothetical protein [Maribacter aquimaris]